jgi:hypothetical protein
LYCLYHLRFYNRDHTNAWNLFPNEVSCGLISKFISLYPPILVRSIAYYVLLIIGWGPSLSWFFRSSSNDSANRPVIAYSDLDVPDIPEVFWHYYWNIVLVYIQYSKTYLEWLSNFICFPILVTSFYASSSIIHMQHDHLSF